MSLLFEKKDFVGAAGHVLHWRIECDALSDEQMTELGKICGTKLAPFSEVHGVPRGGLRLAEALKPFVSDRGSILVVDDVWTTGGSWGKFVASQRFHSEQVAGFVLFSHTKRLPKFVQAMWLPGL